MAVIFANVAKIILRVLIFTRINEQIHMKTTKKGTVRLPRLNNFVCPVSMTPEEWQIALRKQQAQSEDFGISSRGNGEYLVKNANSRSEYK